MKNRSQKIGYLKEFGNDIPVVDFVAESNTFPSDV